MRKIRYSCLVALLLVACIVLASCGVTIDTTMTVDSTGGGFSGTRTMVVTFDADDIGEIEGGAMHMFT